MKEKESNNNTNLLESDKKKESHKKNSEYIEIDILKDVAFRCLKEKFYNQYKNSKESRIKLRLKKDINSDNKFYLGEYFDFLPNGIIDKRVTGIGATTLEMNSKRNSIIVSPTKILAYAKKIKDGDSFYLGSPIGSITSEIKDENIKIYLENKLIKFKKIFVVADSLHRLIKAFKELKIEYGEEYFIMYDEINKFVEDSNFRGNLMNSFDYYKDFGTNNRAMVTATINDYSHPIIKTEVKTYLNIPQRKRNINCIHTNESKYMTFELIKELREKNPDEKIIIAINSLDIPLAIINLLLKNEIVEKKDIFIACSNTKEKEEHIKEYFFEFNSKHNRLSGKIVFLTSTYFYGIDIEDSYHLITVSCLDKEHHKLSTNDIIQIYGRNRKQGGILSDTIIVETQNRKVKGRRPSEESYKKKVENYISCCNRAIGLLNDVNKLYSEVENIDREFTKSPKIDYKSPNIEEAFYNSLHIRKDVEGNYQPAYFVIDTLSLKSKTNQNYKHIDYFIDDIKANLEFEDKDICIKGREFSEREISECKEKNVNLDLNKETEYQNIIKHIEELEKKLHEDNFLREYNHYFKEIKGLSFKNGYVMDFITYFEKLLILIGKQDSLRIIKSIYNDESKNKKMLFNKKYNGVVFALLKDTDRIKNYIINNLQLNEYIDYKKINEVILHALEDEYDLKKKEIAFQFIKQISNHLVKNDKQYKNPRYNESIIINDFNPCSLENTSQYNKEYILKKTKTNQLFIWNNFKE